MDTQVPSGNGGRSFRTLMEEVCQDLSSLQQPSDLITLMTYCMALPAVVRISIEAGIFRHLAASPSPVAANELVRDLGISSKSDSKQDAIEQEEYIIRLLRGVCGLKLADEVGPFVYQANDLTRTLANPGHAAGWIEMYDNSMGPQSTMSHMLTWAKDNRYKAPTASTDGPFQQARGIVGTPTFTHWAKSDPASLSNLSAWMKSIQRDRLNWSAWFPADALFDSPDASGNKGEDVTFMVDVGGGLGHDLTAFAARYPGQKMRLVLQELPDVMDEAGVQDLDSRIELSEHDFFQPEPIKGAKIYFMHKILHDWPDRECIQILTQLRDAMSSDSRIFINDVILPDQGGPLLLAAFDMTMLVQLSGKERSESMWKRLISHVGGLAVHKYWQAPELKGEGIVEVVRTS